MKRVLVAPLDWGLGHATRCIPIIRKLLEKRCEVLIAGSGDSLLLLKAEFPTLKFCTIPAYNPVYPENSSMVLKMIMQIPKFFRAIRAEHKAIAKIILKEKVDLVISDNRYGCWSDAVPSVFITHQSNILMPKRFGWLQGVVRAMNLRYMKKFSRCWIPDFAGPSNLAGELITFGKTDTSLKINYIGPLSRFRPSGIAVKKMYDVVAIFSGPEPQRTILENMIMPQLTNSRLRYFVVRGLLSSGESVVNNNIADFLRADDLLKIIESSEFVLARSGYSTVMDMAGLGKNAIFIPTPGQTEQEYLAKQLMKNKIAFYMQQDQFDISIAIAEAKKYSGFGIIHGKSGTLDKALEAVLNF